MLTKALKYAHEYPDEYSRSLTYQAYLAGYKAAMKKLAKDLKKEYPEVYGGLNAKKYFDHSPLSSISYAELYARAGASESF